jgi:hypothetical protein
LRLAQWQQGRVVLPGFPRPAGNGALDRPLFDADGDRRPRTGEHLVWLRPGGSPAAPWAEATITVWRRGPEGGPDDAWREAKPWSPLPVYYDVPGPPPGE